jgi:hypothetical protein
MSREITNTVNNFADYNIKDGQHTFKVLEVRSMQDGRFYIWKLEYGGDHGLVGEQLLMPNMMGDLLRVLACTEIEPNKFDWETGEQVDKTFSATVSHKPDKKDPTKMRQHMSGFLPF